MSEKAKAYLLWLFDSNASPDAKIPAEHLEGAVEEAFLTQAERTALFHETFLATRKADMIQIIPPPTPGSPQVVKILIGDVRRDLPLMPVALPGHRVAVFNVLGDWELTEAAGRALARLVPRETEVLLMPDGKAQALLHVVARETRLPSVVARKSVKAYMAEPLVSVPLRSITTQGTQFLYLDSRTADQLRGKKVLIVDDVVSTGGTIRVARYLLEEVVKATVVGVLAVFTEGDERPDVLSLGHLPLFRDP